MWLVKYNSFLFLGNSTQKANYSWTLCLVCYRFVACQDLVLSRFCAKDFREFNISGIQIQRITRVINRKLRLRFDDAMQSLTEDDDSYLPSPKYVKTTQGLCIWVGTELLTLRIPSRFYDVAYRGGVVTIPP